MTNYIIVDIDGTVADVEHRRGLLPNWKAFFEAMVDDPPIQNVIDFVNHVRAYENRRVIFCTGRPEDYRKETEEWFRQNGLGMFIDDIYMRKSGDHRSDVIVKREMLNDLRRRFDDCDPDYVLDDRQCVVDMWREEGLLCFQVADGDFDNKPAFDDIPTLIMMVGPSGAGKTTMIDTALSIHETPHVISSDAMREEITGDFKDHSQHNRVFYTIRELIKTRAELGLNTVYDATNLRNKDRKKVLELLPKNAMITYVVVDRPLEDKIRDGGWRNDIIMKSGKTLVEQHDQTFKSNLKDILNGDGDPRVAVRDRRAY